MALTKDDSVIIASTSNAAGATVRGTLSVNDKFGGIVTMKITNGGTGPTVQCVGRVMISHNDTLPAAGAAGTDWKTIWQFGGGVIASTITEQAFTFGPEVRHIQIEYTGNTGQAVTVEAIASTYTV